MDNTSATPRKGKKIEVATPTYSAVQKSSTSRENAHETDHGSKMEAQTSTQLVGLPPDETYYDIWYRHTGEPNLDKLPEHPRFKCTKEAEILAEIGRNQITHAITYGNLPRLEVITPEVTHLRTLKLPDPQQLQRLSSLSNLKELTLDGNNFNAGLPAVVGGLTSLERLKISNCRLEDLPENLSSLIHLKKLDLSSNNFIMGLPPVVNKLISLETLNVSRCWMNVDLQSLSSLTNLRDLNLSKNEHLENLSTVTGKLSNLEILHLSDCQLENLPESLSLESNIKHLDLSENDFSSDFPTWVKELSNLETLNLRECNLKDLPQRFSSEVTLQFLNLSYNNIIHLPSVVYKLKNLRHIDLRHNRFLEQIDKEIFQLQRLDVLDCDYCYSLRSPPYEVCKQGFSAVLIEDTPTKLEATEQLEESDISDVEEKGYCDAARDKRLSLKLRLVRDKKIKQLYRNTDQVYPMSDQIRGRVLVINISEFSGAPARTGSDLDCDHLSKLFTDLKFVVSMATQKAFYTAEEIRMAVKEEIKRDEHHRYGMFVLVLMSHGTQESNLLDSCWQPFSLSSILALLSPRNFAAMKGKPKLVIVQACSGGAAPSERPARFSASQPSARLLPESEDDRPFLDSEDFLILRASFEPYSATRSLTHGSWFIRVLVATFYRHANHRDVLTLFQIIQQRVREVIVSTSALSRNLSTTESTFTRKLYLFPGYPSQRS